MTGMAVCVLYVWQGGVLNNLAFLVAEVQDILACVVYGIDIVEAALLICRRFDMVSRITAYNMCSEMWVIVADVAK